MSTPSTASGSQPSQVVGSLLSELVCALHDESDALIAGDLDRLTAVAARKNDLLTRLAPELQRTPDTQRRHLDKVLRDAQRLHDRNAKLFAVRMSMHRARTEALLGAAGGTLYGHTGATEFDRASVNAHARASA